MKQFKHYCNKCGYVVNLDKTQEGLDCEKCDGKLVRDYSSIATKADGPMRTG